MHDLPNAVFGAHDHRDPQTDGRDGLLSADLGLGPLHPHNVGKLRSYVLHSVGRGHMYAWPSPCRKRRFPVVPAYVIIETDVTDPEQYEKYKAASPGAVAGGGGRFLVRGGELAVLEGDWQPSRLVVLEFKDLAAAKRWYQSEAYQEAKKLREGAAHLRAVAVQGLD